MNASSDLFFSVVFVAKRCQHWPQQQLLLGVGHCFQTQKYPGISFALETGSGQLENSILSYPIPHDFCKLPPRVSCLRNFREYEVREYYIGTKKTISQLRFLVLVYVEFWNLIVSDFRRYVSMFGTVWKVWYSPKRRWQATNQPLTSGYERLALWQCIGWCKNIHAVQNWKNLPHMTTCHLPHPMLCLKCWSALLAKTQQYTLVPSRVVNIPEIFHSASGHASSGLVPSDQEFPDFQTSTYIQSHWLRKSCNCGRFFLKNCT